MSPSTKDGRRLLTVVEELAVERVIECSLTEYPELTDVMDAVVWRLARDPECGTPLRGSRRRILFVPSNALSKSTAVLLRYRLTAHQVIIERLWTLGFDPANAVAPAAYSV